ncbi:MAG: hypothetical protein K5695_15420 [Oscillospiraceae bacterium]|nr:hypothetical protein [Oscillospiraceae bacterium]
MFVVGDEIGQYTVMDEEGSKNAMETMNLMGQSNGHHDLRGSACCGRSRSSRVRTHSEMLRKT